MNKYTAELDQIDIEIRKQKASMELPYAKTTAQMKSALETMNYSNKQLANLIEAASQLKAERDDIARKADLARTFNAKIFNLSKELKLSRDEVIALLKS